MDCALPALAGQFCLGTSVWAGERTLSRGHPPRPLFVTNTDPSNVLSIDGQRFLLMSPLVPHSTSPLVGVLNWTAGLPQK